MESYVLSLISISGITFTTQMQYKELIEFMLVNLQLDKVVVI